MSNPFDVPSTLPFSLPPFAEIRQEHFAPAFERGLAEQRAEITAITANSDAPTFENTVVALERSGQMLSRVSRVFFNKCSSDSDNATTALEEEIAPKLSAHRDAIRLDAALFARVEAVRDGVDTLEKPEQRRLVTRVATAMALAGAGLDEADKAKLRHLNSRIATLTTRFQKNLLADTNDLAVVFDDAAQLDGLNDGELSAAAAAADARGLAGRYVVALVLPTGHPWLARLTVRGSRARIMAASRSRGGRGGEYDNRSLVVEITRLRAERAHVLGFPTHAAYVTADQTAGSPEAVAAMLTRLAPIAARNALIEQAALEKVAGHPIEAHDWAFYTEAVRRERFDVDTALMRPYFEAERVLHDGVFFAASALYGVGFTERDDLVAYHPDARIFEVTESDGSPVGLFVIDLYTRDSKRGGAWMNLLIAQNELLGHPSIVVNNLNVPKPASGSPTLLTLDEVTTLFHEFGHALHGLFARVTYPRFSGTSVLRDFVEFPSQVNEMWMLWPEVLANYAVHHETGEPMPPELVDKLLASRTFNEGFATSEYLAAALLDQAWHTIDVGTEVNDVVAFESAALAAAGLDNPAVPPRYSSTYFAHTFAGGYDAGYYSYIWSEVLDADTGDWFAEHGGLTRANGERFRTHILGVGGAREPLEAYREFRGRDADIHPLLERRDLTD